MIDKLKKNFVSEYDQLLEKLDKEKSHKAASVQQEIDKAADIALKRDDSNAAEKNTMLWQDF